MSAKRNNFATPLVENAVKLNQLVFRFMYPYPFYLYVKNGILFCKVDRIWKLKYLPFFTSLFCLTFLFSIGSCLTVPVLKRYQQNSAINIVSLVFSLFFCSCAVMECAIYYFYSKSTEMEFLLNQLCFIERKYYKRKRRHSKDWIGLFLVGLNLQVVAIAGVLPFATVLLELDPYYHVFELVLPSLYERSLSIIFFAFCLRLALLFVCIAEFLRFVTTIVFIVFAFLFTGSTCLQKIATNQHTSRRTTLQLYVQLRVSLVIGDYFFRHLAILFMLFGQILLTATSWMVLKCRHILPVYVILVAGLILLFTTIGLFILLPRIVDICEFSHKFVQNRRAAYHTFNRHKTTYYSFVRWRSQRWLPIRFGAQFTLNKAAETNYYQVLINTITNAVLLINPY